MHRPGCFASGLGVVVSPHVSLLIFLLKTKPLAFAGVRQVPSGRKKRTFPRLLSSPGGLPLRTLVQSRSRGGSVPVCVASPRRRSPGALLEAGACPTCSSLSSKTSQNTPVLPGQPDRPTDVLWRWMCYVCMWVCGRRLDQRPMLTLERSVPKCYPFQASMVVPVAEWVQ